MDERSDFLALDLNFNVGGRQRHGGSHVDVASDGAAWLVEGLSCLEDQVTSMVLGSAVDVSHLL